MSNETDPANWTRAQAELNGCEGNGYCACGDVEGDEESGICDDCLAARDGDCEGEVA